ncbi:MAG TPA: biopolymer transporter ExbD [Kiritimatiellia bacterium]|nr:biopolymer transporter ExbD [Kiritimatiellia bacterium]HRZ13539.1 biopolymer transporter ExbD [Kiritimatiellia bacterium]HSA19156.1 biopolymer transporter ExbD [Kiritimatiellia bacterium]
MNFRPAIRQEPGAFPLAPMMDVIFLLLSFFITTQIFAQWETEIDITLPTAETGQTPQRLPGEIIVNIRPDGGAMVNNQALDDAALGAMLKRLASLFPGQPVVLRADKAVAYEHVVRVLDLCRKADIWNISFATSLPESPAAP